MYAGDVIAVLALRLCNAACDLPKQWISNSIEDQRDWVLGMLCSVKPMSAASFSCCFPLIKQLLSSRDIREEQRLSLLDVMKVHAGLRSDLETVSLFLPLISALIRSYLADTEELSM